MLTFYIMRVGFVAGGYLWGVLLFLPAFILTISLFPETLDLIKVIVEGVRKFSAKRRMARPSVEVPSKNVQVEEVTRPSDVDGLIADIQDFRPYRRPRNEKELEDLLMQHLRGHYPSLRTQLQYERTQIDAQVGRIGIEVKHQPDEAQYDRLFGQIEKYLRHLPYIIVVIGYERSAETTEEFRKRLKAHNWDGRVFVVVK